MFLNIQNSPKNKTIYFDSPINWTIFVSLLITELTTTLHF